MFGTRATKSNMGPCDYALSSFVYEFYAVMYFGKTMPVVAGAHRASAEDDGGAIHR